MKSRRYPYPYKLTGSCILSFVLCAGLLAFGQSRDTAPAMGPPDYDLSWHTIDGGGVMFSSSDDYELSGTIGQPDAGILANGEYELTGGFWVSKTPECAMLSSLPPNCAIDARYPTASDGTTPAGWDAVELTFNGACNASALGPGDFVSTIPIDAVVAKGSVVTVHLAGVIPAGEWTCIDHTTSNTSVCIGALPGDVGSDRISNAADVLEIVDDLNGTRIPPLQDWQCDIDRSGVCNAADVLGVIDMLNVGWNNRSLPACPAGP